MKIRYIAAAMTVLSSLTAAAEVSDIRDTDAVGYLTRAEAMLQTGNAIGALDQLNAMQRLQEPLQVPSDLTLQALSLKARALFECDNARCVEVAREYIRHDGGSEMAQQMRMLCGDYYFYHADYEVAMRCYDDVQAEALPEALADDVTYRRGLTMLRLAHYDDALSVFKSLLTSKEYADPARFYLAYIDYVNGDYRSARSGFEKYALIGEDVSSGKRSLKPSAPDASYYIAQLNFAEGRYAEVAAEVPTLLKSFTDPDITAELNRICGESLFNLGQKDKAEPYLRRYLNFAGTEAQPTARYMAGVICYDNREYDEAAELLEPVASRDDVLGQSASLYLGQCEMKLGEPGAATVAFERAYRMNYDPKVSEVALYNYAAMLSAGSSVPFASSSVELLEQFVKRYPDSELASKADEFLASAYFNEKNYRRALQSINRISNPSASVLQAKQKILYELGVEAISNGNPSEAVGYMSQAANMSNVDSAVATRSLLWLGDAYYNTGNYAKAEQAYKQFLQKAPASDTNRVLARYNLGYALYQQDKYTEARNCFEAVMQSPGQLNKSLVADANTRVADCLYATGKYHDALDLYQQAMRAEANNADYAALQRANMLGLTGKNNEKIAALNRMISDYPNSTWVPTAILEKAQTYMAMGDEQKSIDTYQQLVERYPQSPQSRQGLLQLAIAYSNAGKTAQAEKCYKQVISTWPTSEQAQAANEDLRNIYAARGELEQYAAYLKSIPGAPTLNPDEIDRLTFEAAENAMLENSNDVDLMLRYINQYPDGEYLDRALYSVAQMRYANGQYAEALKLLNQLQSKRADSKMAPEGTLLRAQIYEDTDLGSKHDALEAWRELLKTGSTGYFAEACAGIMRNTDNPTERIEYANRLIHTSGLSTEEMEEAIFYRALGKLSQQQYSAAEADLKQLAENPVSLYGSRASVELAEHYMGRQQWQEAQKLLEEFTDSSTPHQYWMARGFIDLADVYHAQGRKTLARQYIQSLKENYPGSEADILQMIDERLAAWK